MCLQDDRRSSHCLKDLCVSLKGRCAWSVKRFMSHQMNQFTVHLNCSAKWIRAVRKTPLNCKSRAKKFWEGEGLFLMLSTDTLRFNIDNFQRQCQPQPCSRQRKSTGILWSLGAVSDSVLRHQMLEEEGDLPSQKVLFLSVLSIRKVNNELSCS